VSEPLLSRNPSEKSEPTLSHKRWKPINPIREKGVVMETTKVKALELILDWALWPRYEANELDTTNVNRMVEALKAGIELPPIIADSKSMRIVDGFHRHKAYLQYYGKGAEIPVIFNEYDSDSSLFLDSLKANANHGLPLSPKDKVHAILTGRRMGIPLGKLAEQIGMRKEKALEFIQQRTATTRSGQKIPLSAGAIQLAGKKLNKAEEHFARTSNGIQPIVNARLLLNALRGTVNIPLTKQELEVYTQLRDALNDKIEQALANISNVG